MADHLGAPRHDPPPPRGLLERARGHLVDITPLRTDRDFRRLFLGRSVSDFGDEIVMVVVAFPSVCEKVSNDTTPVAGLIVPVMGATLKRSMLE